jgi:hypothetical protein
VNKPADIFARNYDLRGEIIESVDLQFAIRCGNRLSLYCRVSYYALLLRLPNDDSFEGVDDDCRGGLARVYFTPQVCIGIAQD